MNKHPLCSEVTGRKIMWPDSMAGHSFSPPGNQNTASHPLVTRKPREESEKEARDQTDLLYGTFPAATFSSLTFLPIINPSID